MKTNEDILSTNQSDLIFEEILRFADVIWWTMELPEEIFHIDSKLISDLGYNVEDFKSFENFEKIIHPNDLILFKYEFVRFLERKTDNLRVEYRLKNKQNEYFWFESNVIARYLNDSSDNLILIGYLRNITSTKNATLELLENQNNLKKIIDTSKDMIFLKDENFCYLFVNERFANFFSKTTEQIIGHSDYYVMDSPELALNCFKADLDTLNKNKNLVYNKIIKNKYFEIRKFPVDLGNGRIGVGGFLSDITDLKNNQKENFIGLQRNKLHFDNTPLGAIEWDLNFCVKDWNPACERIFGYKKEEAIGRHASFIIPDHFKIHVDIVWQELLTQNGGTRSTNQNLRKNGELIFCEWFNTTIIDEKGTVLGVSSLIEDITERKNNEIKLRESELKYKSIFESFIDIFYEVDIDGRITLISPSVETITGYKPEELTGSMVDELYLDSDDKQKFLDVLFHKGYVNEFELPFVVKNSKIKYGSINAKLKKNSVGEVDGIQGVIRDVTDRKMIENSLKLQLKYSNALNRLMELVISSDITEEILPDVTKIIGEALDIDRALIYQIKFDAEILVGLAEWKNENNPEVKSTIGNYPINILKKCIEQMYKNRLPEISNASNPNKLLLDDKAIDLIHKDMGTKSGIWVPFAFSENSFYMFAFNQLNYEREWAEEDLKFIDSCTKQINLAIQKDVLLKEKYLIEFAMRGQEEKYQLLAQHSSDIISLYDKNHKLLFVSPAVQNILGYTPEEYAAMDIMKIIHDDDREDLQNQIDLNIAIKQKTSTDTVRMKHKNGKYIWIETHATRSYDKDGNHIQSMLISRDISQRKQYENTILELNQTLEAKVKIRTAELQKAMSELEKSNEELINLNQQITRDTIKILDLNEELSNSQNELQLLNEELEFRIAERTKELLEAKEKAEESDRLKTSFLSNISHEFRTPMNGIIGFSKLISDENTTAEERKEYASVLNSSCKRLLSLVNDVVEMSKLDANNVEIKKSNINLDDVILDVFEAYSNLFAKKKINFRYNFDSNSASNFIKTDRQRLFDILDALVNNAHKFTNQGFVEIGYKVKNEFVEIYVQDSGIGIKNEYLDRVFDKFFQEDSGIARTHEGAGLGLAIVKNLVNLLGGNIYVQSQKNVGSTIFIELPI